ncbi:tail connector protein [Escherichia phage vB_EcoM_ESCO47]|nr:tail connector protein [Escherichia phage vB_EcoM_ESCO47]
MEKFMAKFGQGYVQTPFLSESNSVRFKLSIAGSCPLSTTNPYINFQDSPLGGQVFAVGLNVRIINPSSGAIVESKVYNFSTVNDATSNAFVAFMNSYAPGFIFAFVTNNKTNFPPEVLTWFTKAGSSVIPMAQPVLNIVDISYSAFYVSGKNAIALEHIKYGNKKSRADYSTPLEVVYDTIDDIGATGFPVRTFESTDTFLSTVGGTNNEVKRMPTTSLVTPLANYNLKPGDFLYTKFQMMADADLLAQGTTRLSIRFFKSPSTSPISFKDLNFDGTAGQWKIFEEYTKIPADADGFTIYCYRTAAAGQGGLRNIIFTEVSCNGSIPKAAEFGVNGIRVNYVSESLSPPDIMTFPTQSSTDTGKVFGQEFREASE